MLPVLARLGPAFRRGSVGSEAASWLSCEGVGDGRMGRVDAPPLSSGSAPRQCWASVLGGMGRGSGDGVWLGSRGRASMS